MVKTSTRLFYILFHYLILCSATYEVSGTAFVGSSLKRQGPNLEETFSKVTTSAVEYEENTIAPPIGATYEKEIGLPVIGQQKFSLKILSHNEARLLVKGVLNLDEPIKYSISPGGRMNCRLSDPTLKKLRRFRTSLKEFGYNAETDTPYVKVRPPLPKSVLINLKRKDKSYEFPVFDESLTE